MLFARTLDAIFELTAIVGEEFGHFVDPASALANVTETSEMASHRSRYTSRIRRRTFALFTHHGLRRAQSAKPISSVVSSESARCYQSL